MLDPEFVISATHQLGNSQMGEGRKKKSNGWVTKFLVRVTNLLPASHRLLVRPRTAVMRLL